MRSMVSRYTVSVAFGLTPLTEHGTTHQRRRDARVARWDQSRAARAGRHKQRKNEGGGPKKQWGKKKTQQGPARFRSCQPTPHPLRGESTRIPHLSSLVQRDAVSPWAGYTRPWLPHTAAVYTDAFTPTVGKAATCALVGTGCGYLQGGTHRTDTGGAVKAAAGTGPYQALENRSI